MMDVCTTVPVAGMFDLVCQRLALTREQDTYVVGVQTVVIGVCWHDILFTGRLVLCSHRPERSSTDDL
jgi:hypothetical protein